MQPLQLLMYSQFAHFWNGASKECLIKIQEIHPSFNIQFMLEHIDFILKNNTCVFGNEYFLQLQGTTMSTVCVP